MADTSTAAAGSTTRSYTYLTPFGRETYRILLSQDGATWIARIVTLPNRLWAHPNGREALKFLANTAEDAERAAVEAMEAECARSGRRLAPSSAFAPSLVLGTDEPEAAPSLVPPAVRRPRRLLVRYGESTPDHAAVTANLSETGIFIISDRPERTGARLRIDLRFPEGPVQLGGIVVWTRAEKEDSRSVGFGVCLTERPPEYLVRVRSL